jgi:hypothetical protein
MTKPGFCKRSGLGAVRRGKGGREDLAGGIIIAIPRETKFKTSNTELRYGRAQPMRRAFIYVQVYVPWSF